MTTSSDRVGRRRVWRAWAAVIAALAMLAGAEAARGEPFLYGVSGPGFDRGNELLRIDPGTGLAASIGRLRLADGTLIDGTEDITADAAGNLYLSAWDIENTSGAFRVRHLYRVDPTTAVATFLGVSEGVTATEGLAFVGDTLYGSADLEFDPIGDEANHLIRIDPANGEATVIGPFGPRFGNVEAIATSPGGVLYGADIGTSATAPALLTIDTATGAGTLVADLPDDVFLAALTFAPDGVLFASRIGAKSGPSIPSTLVRVDPTTGALTEIGPIGFTDPSTGAFFNYQLVDGLVYVVPEPAGVVSLATGGAGLLGLAWRRRRRARRPG